MTTQLGRLEALDPRAVWVHEAHQFTPWLLDNADALASVLGIDLELSAAEHPVGGFALDLVGRDLTNNCVLIVENQLTTTDHGHLGQILTYAAGTDAGTVVWMATAFREEHRQALDFLNDLGGEKVRFFGVEIGVVRIGPSEPAPLFKLRAQPNDWHAEVAAAAKSTSQQAGKAPLYQAFWSRFLERVRIERPGWTNAQKPQTANWFEMPSPLKGGPYYAVSFAHGGKLRNELYIDYGNAEQNTALFDSLAAQKELIEGQYGAPLSWEDLPEKRACRIADYSHGDVSNGDQFDRYIDWFFDSGTRLRPAIDAAVHRLTQAALVLVGTRLVVVGVERSLARREGIAEGHIPGRGEPIAAERRRRACRVLGQKSDETGRRFERFPSAEQVRTAAGRHNRVANETDRTVERNDPHEVALRVGRR